MTKLSGWIRKDIRSYLPAVSESQNHRCAYCGIYMSLDVADKNRDFYCTADHIIPQSQGGGHDRENMIAACALCNSSRSDMDADIFFVMVQKNGRKNPLLTAEEKEVRKEIKKFFQDVNNKLVQQKIMLRFPSKPTRSFIMLWMVYGKEEAVKKEFQRIAEFLKI